MGENAELYSYPDEASIRRTLINWLREHNIDFDATMKTEELRQLYIDIECGKYK